MQVWRRGVRTRRASPSARRSSRPRSTSSRATGTAARACASSPTRSGSARPASCTTSRRRRSSSRRSSASATRSTWRPTASTPTQPIDGLLSLVAHNTDVPGLVQLYAQVSTEAAGDPDHPAHAFFVERYGTIPRRVRGAHPRRAAGGSHRRRHRPRQHGRTPRGRDRRPADPVDARPLDRHGRAPPALLVPRHARGLTGAPAQSRLGRRASAQPLRRARRTSRRSGPSAAARIADATGLTKGRRHRARDRASSTWACSARPSRSAQRRRAGPLHPARTGGRRRRDPRRPARRRRGDRAAHDPRRR